MQCKNCEQPLTETNCYCGDCGAKVIGHRLTLRYLASEVYQGFFSIDSNKPLRTFVDLFRKPEAVIDGYIQGVRKRYINAFGYFTIAVTISSLFFFVFLQFFPEYLSLSAYQQPDMTAEQIALQQKWNRLIFENQTIVLFLSIPLFALISKLIFLRNKKYNYTEHLVINLYAYSQISIFMVLLYFSTIWVEPIFYGAMLIAMPVQVIYYSYVLKRLYGLTLSKTLLKVLLFLMILSVVFIIAIAIALIIMLFTGQLEALIEAERAKQGISYIASSAIN